MDIHTAMMWCCIHGSIAVSQAIDGCTFCNAAIADHVRAVRIANANTTIGKCGFCGGPTPCLRES